MDIPPGMHLNLAVCACDSTYPFPVAVHDLSADVVSEEVGQSSQDWHCVLGV